MTTITVNPDRSVRIETDTHLCILPQNPETMAPFASDEEAEAFARSIAGDPRYMVPKPAPQPNRTALTRTEYYGQFTAIEEAMIRIAADEPVTATAVQAATGAEKQRLIGVAALKVMLRRIDALAPSDRVDVADPQVQQGLGLLVSLGLMTQERVAEIMQGIPR